jgi:hypothetical protein
MFASYATSTVCNSTTFWNKNIMPPKKKGATKQRGVGGQCNILLKYLHPQVLINSKIPKPGWTHKQELTDCVIVSRETRNIDRKGRFVIVVKHPAFGESLIYCAERYPKVNSFQAIRVFVGVFY